MKQNCYRNKNAQTYRTCSDCEESGFGANVSEVGAVEAVGQLDHGLVVDLENLFLKTFLLSLTFRDFLLSLTFKDFFTFINFLSQSCRSWTNLIRQTYLITFFRLQLYRYRIFYETKRVLTKPFFKS